MQHIEWNADLLQDDTLKVSTLMVMMSGAGFYIGRFCMETDRSSDSYYGGRAEPYIRVSEAYFQTEELAKAALDSKTYTIRRCIENDYVYEKYPLLKTAK